jgi:X-Pro dipeptidyl-peptidase-like protein
VVSGQLAGGPVPAQVSAPPATAPSAASRNLSGPLRIGLSFIVGFTALLLVAAGFGASPWSWLLWPVAGVAAGSIDGRARHVWIAPVIVSAFYLAAGQVGLTEDAGKFWLIGAVVGMILVAAGFGLGTLVAWRESPRQAIAAAWHHASRARRAAVVAAIAVPVLLFGAYTAYFVVAGTDLFMHPGTGSTACANPGGEFGWAYEAINYDKADDAVLASNNADMTKCSSQGSPAGNAVVSSDGVALAGWYIPAASAVGATGPTVLVVPGYNSNKSDVLQFAEPFHAGYNLVLMDLRNQGRSGAAAVTMGLHEQRDIAAILDWLVATKHPGAIAAMGNSMGAASILAEARTDPRIEAFILDSMHANYEVTLGNALEVDYGFPSVPGAAAIRFGSDLRTGGDVRSIDPVRTITQVGDRPVLLLHSTTDKIDPPAQTAEKNQQAALAAGVPVELQYCQGATTGNGSHGHVIDRCPESWSRWANQFLEASLAD